MSASRQNSRTFLLFFLAALAAFGPFVTDFYLPTLPEQTQDFSTTSALVQLGLSTTMWGLAVGQLFVGPWSDKSGRKAPLAWCLALFTLSTLGAATAPSITIFLVMRFLEGLGASGAIVMSRSIAADRYTGRELGSFMAIMGAIQGIAPVSAPLLGALIAASAGWRGIFWLLFAAGVALLATTLLVLAETHVALRNRKAHTEATPHAAEPVKTSARILFSDPIFVGIVLQQFLSSAVLFGHISSSPFILRGHFGLSAETYGLAFGGLALTLAIGATASARIADPLKALAWGAFGMFAGALLLSGSFALDFSILSTIPSYVILLVALGLTLPAAMTAALTLHRARAGFAAAILGSVSFVGGGLVAPLTTFGDARFCLSVILVVSTGLLSLLSLWLNRHSRSHQLNDARGEALEFHASNSTSQQ